MKVPRDRPPSLGLAVAAAAVYELTFQVGTYLTLLIYWDPAMLRDDLVALLLGGSGQGYDWAARGPQVALGFLASAGGLVTVLVLGLRRWRPPLRHLGLSAVAAVASVVTAVVPPASVRFQLPPGPALVALAVSQISPPLVCVLIFGLDRPGRFRLFRV